MFFLILIILQLILAYITGFHYNQWQYYAIWLIGFGCYTIGRAEEFMRKRLNKETK